ncbi:MAG TPA: hypothetical protein VLX68_13165 [Chitinivibrionales bacterium]|nr:hypothetical protein [Chitinivibrionales bacterium]
MKNLENKTYHKLMPDIDSTNIKVVYQKNAKTLLCFVSIFHNHGHRYNVQAFSAKDLKAENEMLLPDLLWEGVLNNSTKTYVGLNEVRQVIVAFPNEKQEKSAKENVVKWEYYRYTLSYDSAGNNIPNIKGILIWGKPVIVDTVSQ